ncbi:MAG: outer membrane beta-barrel protein [Campylobacterota bacterium]|nr:outer membrane beta-barrel protein [Campylobacterota bacterium]
MKKFTLSLVSIIALSSISFAEGDVVSPMSWGEVENPFYGGIALAATSTRGSNADLSFFSEKDGQDRLGNLTLNAGYDFNQFVAVEARYTTDISNEDIVEMSGWSLFVKPQYPVSEDFTIYALLGFGGVTVDGIHPIRPVHVDDNSFQWGLGISYSLKNAIDYNIEIYADYTSLAKDMDGVYWNGDLQTSVDALTVGVAYRF